MRENLFCAVSTDGLADSVARHPVKRELRNSRELSRAYASPEEVRITEITEPHAVLKLVMMAGYGRERMGRRSAEINTR